MVIKRLDPDVAWRNQLVATRWLPSVGLDGLAPGLLGVAPEGSGEAVWHIYEDLGDLTLEVDAPDSSDIEQAVRAIAALHTTFAGQPRLAECRLWGGDLGISFFAASVRDASSALHSVDPSAVDVDGFAVVRGRLLGRLSGLLAELPRRAEEMVSSGGPETLLHGDLWRPNIVPIHRGRRPARPSPRLGSRRGGADRVRPFDSAAAFSAERSFVDPRPLPRGRRAGWLDARGRRHVERRVRHGGEQGRIANRVIWPAIAIIEGDRRWGPAALSETESWFEALAPVLPEGGSR